MAEKWFSQLQEGKILPESDLKELCSKVKDILIEESNIITTSPPVIICGDLHGQFYDLLELFKKSGGFPPEQKYIFLGDYIDRGSNSVETIEMLICLKCLYPDKTILIRGNHESRNISFIYGFYDEINRKYGNSQPWKLFNEIFDLMPLCAVIDKTIFCVHGGLSPLITTIDQIRLINRKGEIPHEGAICDLLWSDPTDENETWVFNSRGAGWMFGYKVTNEFNQINGIELICRAHQLAGEGIKYWFKEKNLVTIWSCPNYCYRCGNKAGIIKLDANKQRTAIIFDSVPKSKESATIKTLVPYFL